MNILAYLTSFLLLLGVGVFAIDHYALQEEAIDTEPAQVQEVSEPTEPDVVVAVEPDLEPVIIKPTQPLVESEPVQVKEEQPLPTPVTTTASAPIPPSPVPQDTLDIAPEPIEIEIEKPRGGLTSFFFGDDDDDDDLTELAILSFSNAERVREGLPAYETNTTLNAMAAVKLDDMLENQYFEHVSPDGVTIADLADQVGYPYLLVGENLAVGDFRNSEHVVEEWMNSPGHRANILHENYTQIGIAAKRGVFEGKETWLAVQEFGLPRDVCPSVDASLKREVDDRGDDIERRDDELRDIRDDLNDLSQSSPSYGTLVETYNTLVEQYNALIAIQKSAIAEYNGEVGNYNDCISDRT